ncbi:hypothetical protein PR048_025853 [Dryococelus australis]|uniref:Uncharacterized protein n=1 Tax=Dryococelus australis TaxID=614101 RepID=A0ABQ9GJQ3_9NEOP|nr:hypothetical protein PR048_025853 [Dryococelus australis]
MRVVEVSMEQRRNGGWGKREIPEKTRQPTASSGTIPTYENPEPRGRHLGEYRHTHAQNCALTAQSVGNWTTVVRGGAEAGLTSQRIKQVAERLACSPPTKAIRVQSPAWSPDFRKWESRRTMPLINGSSQGSPVSPSPSCRRRSIFTSITLIGSQDLAVKNRPNTGKIREFNDLQARLHGVMCNRTDIDCPLVETWSIRGFILGQAIIQNTTLESSLRVDLFAKNRWPYPSVMDAVKYRVVAGVVWTNMTMVSSNTDINRTGVLTVVNKAEHSPSTQSPPGSPANKYLSQNVAANQTQGQSLTLPIKMTGTPTLKEPPHAHVYSPTVDKTKGRGKREIPEKTRRLAASSGTILTCDDLGVSRQGIEPGEQADRSATRPPRTISKMNSRKCPVYICIPRTCFPENCPALCTNTSPPTPLLYLIL